MSDRPRALQDFAIERLSRRDLPILPGGVLGVMDWMTGGISVALFVQHAYDAPARGWLTRHRHARRVRVPAATAP